MKRKGYIGKVLEVDLSSQHMKVNELDEEILYKYIGARGLGIRLLTDLTAAQINPLSPQNNGTGVFSAFFNVTTKAPLTGISGSSHCGGKWGPRLKGAGFDGVVVKGACENPCYLLIEEGNAALLDGQEIWGKGTMETERILLDKHKGAEVVVIGPAGEKLVKFAAIMNDQRAAARGGVGAVMGSKKLKAIVVKGKTPIEMFDRDKVLDISKRGGKLALENGKNFARYGTSMAFSFFNEKGVLPTRNFREGYFPEAEKINAEALKTQYFVKDQGCETTGEAIEYFLNDPSQTPFEEPQTRIVYALK